MSVLGLAAFAVGKVVNLKGTPSSTSFYDIPARTSLSRWHPIETVPTRSMRTTPIYQREEASPTVTSFAGCPSGWTQVPSTHSEISCSSFWSYPDGGRSCTLLSAWPTLGCSQTVCPSGETPRSPTYTEHSCTVVHPPDVGPSLSCTDVTKTFTDNDTCLYTSIYSRTWRHVARFAQTTQDLGGRSQRAAAQFDARSTQDFGGRSQRAVAQFAAVSTQVVAESTITAEPDADLADAAAPPFPTCSFDLSKGQYICPETAPKTLPICSFNLSKGEYVCPTPVIAAATPTAVEPTTLKTMKN